MRVTSTPPPNNLHYIHPNSNQTGISNGPGLSTSATVHSSVTGCLNNKSLSSPQFVPELLYISNVSLVSLSLQVYAASILNIWNEPA